MGSLKEVAKFKPAEHGRRSPKFNAPRHTPFFADPQHPKHEAQLLFMTRITLRSRNVADLIEIEVQPINTPGADFLSHVFFKFGGSKLGLNFFDRDFC